MYAMLISYNIFINLTIKIVSKDEEADVVAKVADFGMSQQV